MEHPFYANESAIDHHQHLDEACLHMSRLNWLTYLKVLFDQVMPAPATYAGSKEGRLTKIKVTALVDALDKVK